MTQISRVEASQDRPQPFLGSHQEAIEGRYRKIVAHLLVMAWWLFAAGHITKRQLRVYFAAHEMAERRRYTKTKPFAKAPREPSYRLEEVKELVGGRGSDRADADLTADIKALATIGLVTITDHAITFARGIEDIAIADRSGFLEMLDQVPNPNRGVPIPRRTLRALAAGFTKAVTGVMLAMLIRGVFWHKATGLYRTDGRTKLAWIAEVFRLSRRAVTDARAHLIALGWLTEIDTAQWELNRWGIHDQINVDWQPLEEGIEAPANGEPAANDNGHSASPPTENHGGFASPCLNNLTSPKEDLKNNTLAPNTAERTVVSKHLSEKTQKPTPSRPSAPAPSLKNIKTEDLYNLTALLTLHIEASRIGLSDTSPASELEFLAMAERAKAKAKKPAALFMWLLKHKKSEFVTQIDEDRAREMLRDHRYGSPSKRWSETVKEPVMSDEEKLVEACLRVAKDNAMGDAYPLAKQIKGWTRDEWELHRSQYEIMRQRQAFAVSVGEMMGGNDDADYGFSAND